MVILFLAAGEVVSILVTQRLSQNFFTDIILELGKNGYKFNKKINSLSFDKQVKPTNDNDPQNEEKSKIIDNKTIVELNPILLYVPVVNIIYVQLIRRKVKKDIMSFTELDDFLMPMTDNEKIEYSKLKSNSDRLTFSFFIINHDFGNSEFVGFSDGDLKIHDRNIVLTSDQRLDPLGYSLDEVKRLNNVTNNNYILGELNGVNTAIIGIKDLNLIGNKIKLISNYRLTENDYVRMTDEVAKDKKFVVYSNMDECSDKISKEIDNILVQRNLPDCQSSSINKEFIYNQNGPLLKRTLDLKKN